MSTNILPFVPDTPDALRVKCAADGCERLAYDGSALCGECLEAQAAQADVIWHGKDAIPNKRAEAEDELRLGRELSEREPVEEVMPATVCSHCEAALAAGEYRVEVSATSCEILGQFVETETITRTLCHACTMDPDQFMTGWFRMRKLIIDSNAKWAASAPEPGEDALDYKRATTGHGGKVEGAATPNLDYNPKALPEGAAPTEPRSQESVRRETLRNFLGDRARSWSKLKPRQREVVKLYVQGLSQSEIGRRVGLDQANVSRMIQSALKEAR